MWLLVAGTKALLAQLGAIPGFPHAARRHSRSFFFFFGLGRNVSAVLSFLALWIVTGCPRVG